MFFSDAIKFPNKWYSSYKPYTEDKGLKIIHNTPKWIKDVLKNLRKLWKNQRRKEKQIEDINLCKR